MNRIDTKKIKRKLTVYVFTRFILTLLIYSIILIGLFSISPLLRRYFSFGNGFIYSLLWLFWNNAYIVFIASWSIGFILIFFVYWRKTLGYVEVMIDANNVIFQNNENLIHLPTELKEVEDQLNQIKYDVLRNERAAREAEQRKNDLVVYLAHDLKTPLTSVIGYLTLLRDEQKISEELREKYLQISLEKAERLEDLINEFFEITRFNLTQISLELSKVNLKRMLEQIIHEFAPMYEPKDLTCVLTADHEIVINCDVSKLERVFDNLIRNAINYSFESSRIEITAVKNESGVSLKFFNRGNTIPEQKLNHIFEQFYRLDTARTSKNGGAGLGLAIAKEIVELHKGKITARSQNEEIEFEVFLPNIS